MTRFVPLAISAIACAAMIVAPVVSPVVIWNASHSVPMGLYLIKSHSPGFNEIAVLRLPKWASTLADERQYLPSSAVLLKPVAGTEGDVVCRLGRHVFVNGKLRAKALRRDKMKRLLPSWRRCFRLRAGQIFVLSNWKGSFDSRYFGVISERYVLGTGRLMFSIR